MRRDSAANQELLLQILNSTEDVRRVIQMQQNGQHVAERLMEAGQYVSLNA